MTLDGESRRQSPQDMAHVLERTNLEEKFIGSTECVVRRQISVSGYVPLDKTDLHINYTEYNWLIKEFVCELCSNMRRPPIPLAIEVVENLTFISSPRQQSSYPHVYLQRLEANSMVTCKTRYLDPHTRPCNAKLELHRANFIPLTGNECERKFSTVSLRYSSDR